MAQQGVKISNLSRSSGNQGSMQLLRQDVKLLTEDSGKISPSTPSSSRSTASPADSGTSSSFLRNGGTVTDYLTQLLRDQSLLQQIRGCFQFQHLDRILEEEIEKVRSKLLETVSNQPLNKLELPEPVGEVEVITHKVFFPKKQWPDFNFTGRILGPRGSTIKRLEKEIGPGCTLAIRGKGSDPKNESNRPSKEEQHVLVTIKETPNRSQLVLQFALQKIAPFLLPVDEEQDELKKSQMIELALLKGNYRDGLQANARQMTDQFQRMMLTSTMLPSGYRVLRDQQQQFFYTAPQPMVSSVSTQQMPMSMSMPYSMSGQQMAMPASSR